MRITTRFFACIFALLFAPQLAAHALAADPAYSHLKWRSIGPAVSGGRVPAVAGTASNPNLYYIGSAGGGVWKSENGGATWTAVFEKQPVSAIGAVTIDPNDENTVWVGTGESNPRNDVSYGNGVYKTTDGGKTWTNMGLVETRHISRIIVDPSDSNHVIVGASGDPFRDSTERGVFVTNDGGKTWDKTLYIGPQTGASEVAMDPNHPAVLYAGMWQFRRLPWTFHSGGPQDGLYKSIDGGKTWSQLTGNGLPTSEMGRIAVAVAPNNSNRVYAVIEAKGGILWRSDDAGATWEMVSDNTIVDQRPFYFTHINVDPSNANHVYAVSNDMAESRDGGRRWRAIANAVHVDFHAMWIAPNNPNRMILGEDGGYAITVDGRTWSFSRNIPIGQVYHVGVSNENPYWVCAPLQDNNAFCGPSNSRNRSGILDDDWRNVVGGDGMWAVPDPGNGDYIMADSQTGNITVYNKTIQGGRGVIPYFDFDRNSFNLANRKYRFNWDSPIAFAPWNSKVLWLGGDVVFQSTDRGVHWTPISPDLTRNIKEHQIPAGGPLATDVSSAEFSDNLLYIEGSRLRAGEIWVGTDDGLVQMTRDGGKHWRNVTPAGPPYLARVETVAPSPIVAGTAYAIFDDHRSGNYAPYIYVTHNYGSSWTKIVNGLPADQYVRTVRPDGHNKNLVFAGTENGLWVSYDGGANWNDFRLNIPAVSVRDIREQSNFNDLAIATHGRALWIFDDLTSLQQLPQAQRQGSMLFKPRTAYQYITHSNDEGLYTRFSGDNPPNGAIIDYYLGAAQKSAPTIEILNAKGQVIRHIRPPLRVTNVGTGEDVPVFFGAGGGPTDYPGINRVTWNFREDGVTQWTGNPQLPPGAAANAGAAALGVAAIPGTYSARVTLNGRTYTQSFQVKKDPLSPFSQSDFQAAYNFAKKYLVLGCKINTVLNNLDAQKKSLTDAQAALQKSGNTALLAQVNDAMKARDAIFSVFTANYKNGEDSLQWPGALREDLPGGGFGAAGAPPTPARLEYAARYDREYASAMARYNAFVSGTLVPLSAALKTAGAGTIAGATQVH
ncbi:MAG TPA: hypothetical protein VFO29_00605 [Candidatus Rubrimentiphilum sp.]|nr:hypothetical protein [Candidatus Rubrimentiphilum sp.]